MSLEQAIEKNTAAVAALTAALAALGATGLGAAATTTTTTTNDVGKKDSTGESKPAAVAAQAPSEKDKKVADAAAKKAAAEKAAAEKAAADKKAAEDKAAAKKQDDDLSDLVGSDDSKVYTLEEISELVLAAAKAKGRGPIMALLKEFNGAVKAGQIPVERYNEFAEKANALIAE